MPSSKKALGSCKQVADVLEGLYIMSGAHSSCIAAGASNRSAEKHLL